MKKREFIKLAALGAGAGLFNVALPVSMARAAGSTEALLLSCMDYRLMDDIERYMSKRGLRDKYDHVVLAGASLGAVTSRYPAWGKTFWDHLGIALDLHHIHKVIVMDHRDCGAYKVILGEDFAKDARRETNTHAAQLQKLAGEIARKHPKLEVETLLMALNGTVEKVGPAGSAASNCAGDAPVAHKNVPAPAVASAGSRH
jgi:carbonic anhydrase